MESNYRKLLSNYTDEILEIIDNREDFTRSDLQAIVIGIVSEILKKGGESICN